MAPLPRSSRIPGPFRISLAISSILRALAEKSSERRTFKLACAAALLTGCPPKVVTWLSGGSVLNTFKISDEAIKAPIGIPDRRSTRLNSSHVDISYAVFCLKKQNKDQRSNRDKTLKGS